jgi:transcriptional regulator with XRE-family HTH domain
MPQDCLPDHLLRQVIGHNVRERRLALGLTQIDLCHLIKQLTADSHEIRQGTISSIERAARCPSVSLLVLIASALDVSVSTLVTQRHTC